MSELISGKEALIALANGQEVECKNDVTGIDWCNADGLLVKSFFDPTHMWELRLKPRTITINGIEVPAPFEPKVGERYWSIGRGEYGYYCSVFCGDAEDEYRTYMGAWRTEDEVKQVVAALRKIFNLGVKE